MPQQEPVMSAHEPAAEQPLARALPEETAPQPGLAYEPLEQEGEWDDEPEQLPRRPRRRLLAPLPVALMLVLVTACGFIAGVLVEKGQGSSSGGSSAASSLASRFAALRGATGTTGTSRTGTSGTGASTGAGGFAGAFGGAGGATTGEVQFIQGDTLYVTNSEGNTVKVTTSAGSTVTKTVKASVKDIHPGETVVVTGSKGSNGTVSAESIRVGGEGGGGLAALFGGAGGGSSSSGTGGSGTSTGTSSGPALFGP